MKFILPTACFALLATSAFAADPAAPIEADVTRQVSGHGEIYGGAFWFDELSDDKFWAAGGVARVNVPFADSWNVQGDFGFDVIGEDGDHLRSVGGVLHVNWRDPASYAVGGFFEAKTYGVSGGGGIDLWDWKVGPEAQLYFDRVTLYGQAYYGQLEIADFNTMGVRGVVRYFAQDNLRLDAELGFHRLNIDVVDFDLDLDTIAVALQGTYRFSDTPWSVFGRYQYENTSFSIADGSFDTHKLTVGLRASFGSRTLLEEDRNGATMDTYRPNYVMPF